MAVVDILSHTPREKTFWHSSLAKEARTTVHFEDVCWIPIISCPRWSIVYNVYFVIISICNYIRSIAHTTKIIANDIDKKKHHKVYRHVGAQVEEIWAHLLEKGTVDQVERGLVDKSFRRFFLITTRTQLCSLIYIYMIYNLSMIYKWFVGHFEGTIPWNNSLLHNLFDGFVSDFMKVEHLFTWTWGLRGGEGGVYESELYQYHSQFRSQKSMIQLYRCFVSLWRPTST